MTTGEVIGHEALVRPAPGSGFNDSESLFAAAEATGRMVELDTACIAVVAAAAGFPPPGRYTGANLSPRTPRTEAFSASRPPTGSGKHGDPPASLGLRLAAGDGSRPVKLAINDVSRIHFHGGGVPARPPHTTAPAAAPDREEGPR